MWKQTVESFNIVYCRCFVVQAFSISLQF